MKKSLIISSIVILAVISLFIGGCDHADNSLAPYAGSPKLSKITIEQGVFKPKMTWVGGKISAIAVNHGSKAILDSSLVWMIHISGNNLDYPVKFGQLPAGVQDVTADLGGHKADSLYEDNSYTIWVIKDDVWSQISQAKNKILVSDSSLSAGSVKLVKDSLHVSSASLSIVNQKLDVFVNIDDITQYGSLGFIDVIQPTTGPDVTVTWQINNEVTNDSLVSAIGVAEGNAFDENFQIWAAWSEEKQNNNTVYGKSNIISSPVKIGQKISGTKEFYQFPAAGFTRGKYYVVWIGNKDWDQKGRVRSTPFYAYATFRVR